MWELAKKALEKLLTAVTCALARTIKYYPCGEPLTSENRFYPTVEFWRGRRVLVTGHTGFKGGWLTMWLTQLGAHVSGFALLPDRSPNFFEAIKLEHLCDHRLGDIRNIDDLVAAFHAARPEIVFHLAAQALVRQSYRDPLTTIATNVMGTAHVIEACRQSASVRAVVVVTSDKVYENPESSLPHHEDDPLGGHDIYAASKACADIIAQSYSRAHLTATGAIPIFLATARAGNVIGGGDWAEDRLIPDLARAFAAGNAAAVRAPTAIRPWQHVLDVVRGYLMIARALIEQGLLCPRTVNLGPDQTVATVGEIAEGFACEWGNGQTWCNEPEAGAPYEAKYLALDATLALRALGWQTRLTLARSLAMTATWYRLHAAGEGPSGLRKLSLAQIAEADTSKP